MSRRRSFLGRLCELGLPAGAPPELATRVAAANVATAFGGLAGVGLCTLAWILELRTAAFAGATQPVFMALGMLAMARGHQAFGRVWVTCSASLTVVLVACTADAHIVLAVPLVLAMLPFLVLLPGERVGLALSTLCTAVAATMVFWVERDPTSAGLTGALTSTSAFVVLQGILWASARARDRDLQELRAAKQLAERAAAARSMFLANMSHELRTPLGAVVGYADLLKKPALGEEERLEIAEVLRRNGDHLIEVVNQILDLSKMEAGQLLIDRQPASICQVVEDVASVMRVQAAKKQLDLRVDYRTRMPNAIMSDAFRMRQVLINLVGNAIKFSERGCVTMRVSVAEGSQRPVRVDVVDSGIGIAPDRIERLFEPFTQEDASTHRQYGGTGLGLTISRQLARLLGGDLEARSELGHGSTFSLCLPASEAELADTSDPSQRVRLSAGAAGASEQRLDGIRILLAEDFVDAARLLRLHLEGRGASVVCVGDGLTAVERIAEAARGDRPFQIALMDMQMPTMDGYEATRTLRASGHTLPVMALTAHAMSGDREQCLAVGCSGYLTKPVEIEGLVAEIARHVPAGARPQAPKTPPSPALAAALAGLSRRFAENLPGALSGIRSAITTGALDTARRAAHNLAGGAGMFGQAEVGSAASELEQAIALPANQQAIQDALERLLHVGSRDHAS